jgi:carbamate kinase
VLARQLGASTLLIATDVEAVVEGQGTAAARPIGEIKVAALRALAKDGQFPAGSMGPKVEAACRFAEGGGRAIITSLHHIADALAGKTGTVVIP